VSDAQRTCFAIMPIRARGTPEHAHFAGIYNQIRQVVAAEGYETVRADEVTDEGTIAKDIITRLAASDLVIADLSDLNPNVFWELGVRHTLRAAGTLLLLDEIRTEDPPFDLGYLRILKYRGTVEGLTDLHDQLVNFVRGVGTDPSHVRSPVHEWIRHLPPNLSVPASDAEAVLRNEVADQRARLERYERKYGSIDDQEIVDLGAPIERMRRIQRLTSAGLLPSQMMQALKSIFEAGDIPAFINKVAEAIEHRVGLDPDDILRVSAWAGSLDLDEVSDAILTYGEELHPTDDGIERSILVRMAHGRTSEERSRAREAMARNLGFNLETGEFVEAADGNPDLGLVGFFADTLHADKLHAEAIEITEAFNRRYPHRAPLLRILGRAHENAGDIERGTEIMLEAIRQPDVDDVAAYWLGNTFHNIGRHMDALEMYLVACWIDPDDGRFFSLCAADLSFGLFEPYTLYDPHSPLNRDVIARVPPSELTGATVLDFVAMTFSTRNPSADAVARCSDSMSRAELEVPGDELARMAHEMTRAERKRGVAAVYAMVASSLSAGCPARVKPTAENLGTPAAAGTSPPDESSLDDSN
jgi:tetratricopeptide (TPR) repeat protein